MPRPESFQARSSSGGAVPEPQTRQRLAPDARTAAMSTQSSAVAGSKGCTVATRTPYRLAEAVSAPVATSA